MYVIVVYDVDATRTEIFKKICQIFLIRIQNSVFEGEINEAQLMRLKSNITKKVKENDKVKIWITSKIIKEFRIGKYDTVEDGIL